MKYLILFLLLVVQVSAAAPTQFYGRVTYDDGRGVAGLTVTANYMADDGSLQQAKTSTISYNAEMTDNLIGYYFFNQGRVEARAGSEIIIIAGSKNVTIDANPYSNLLQVEAITLESNPIELDVSEGGVVRGLISNQPQPLLPTSRLVTRVYGTLVGESGTPLQGVEVNATYTNNQNEVESVSTTTGEGVSGGRFTIDTAARENSTITIESENISVEVESRPGETVEVRQLQANNTIPVQTPPLAPQDGTTFEQEEERINIIQFLWWLLVIPVMGIVYGSYFVGKRAWLRWRVGHARGLHGRVRKLQDKKVSEMAVEIFTSNTDTLLSTILSQMIAQNQTYVLVMKGEHALGIITFADIIKKVEFPGDFSSLTAKDVMHSPVQFISHEMSFHEVVSFSLSSRVRVLPLLKKGKIIGAITRRDLLEEFDRFFSTSEVNTIPTIRLAVREAVSVRVNDSLTKVIDTMKAHTIETVFVTQKKESGKESIVGIVRDGDMIEEIANYSSLLEKMDVARIMKVRVHSVMPSTTLLEANKIMLDLHLRLLPVARGEELLGAVSEQTLLQSMHGFLESLLRVKGQ